jgi:spore coat protein CotH
VLAGLLATSCGSDGSDGTGDDARSVEKTGETAVDSSKVFDDSYVHDISVTFDEADYDAMIETYSSAGDKEWIVADITIDGSDYNDVGLRLKGNSSLMGIRGDWGGRTDDPAGSADAEEPADNADAAEPATPRGGPGGSADAEKPETLPWLIRLDKNIDDQNHEGVTELVIRSSNSETSLNEAVALELLEVAGLASQDAMATSFTVNGGDAKLRLAIEHPGDLWVDERFGTGGSLYKAESTGDFSYRGDDPASYDEVFDLEAGDDENLEHLTEFLQFINEADDATFAAELPDRLDVEAFATYLASQELLGNFDDIDGPGNNAYLYYDPETEQFTVVPWDMNLAFNAMMGGAGAGSGGPPEGFDPSQMPEGFDPSQAPEGFDPSQAPEGFDPSQAPPGGTGEGGQGGGPRMNRSNVLVERFKKVESFKALYDEALVSLKADLFESGKADEVLARWVKVLEDGGGDLVDKETITTEADNVAANF